MNKYIVMTLFALFLTACNDDGVPKIEDPNNITVDGQAMTADVFYSQYCKLKPSHETCIAVDRVVQENKAKAAHEEVQKHFQKNTAPRF